MEEITLRDILRILFRHKLMITVVVVVVMVSVYIAAELRTQVYRTDVRILVTGRMQKDVEVQRELGPGSLIETQLMMVRSKPVIERAVMALKLYERPLDYEKKYASKLKGILIDQQVKEKMELLKNMNPEQRRAYLIRDAASKLYGNVDAVPEGDTSFIQISVRDFDPLAAAKIANVLSRAYVIFDLEQQIAALNLTYGKKNVTIKKLRNFIEKMEKTLDGRLLPEVEALGPATVKIVDQAGPGKPILMKPGKNTLLMIGFLMSIVGGIGIAMGFEYLDPTFRSSGDIQKYLQIPCLGSVPKRKFKKQELIKHANPTTKHVKAYQDLANQVYLLMKDKNFKSFLIADVEGAVENAVVIANLGLFLSKRTGNSVILIDANLRNSSLSKIFNVSDVAGLADILEERNTFENTVQSVDSNLYILPSGKTSLNSLLLLESSSLAEVMRKAKEHFEIVLINCADIKNFPDGGVLGSLTDGFLLIINEGKVKHHIVRNAIDPIEKNNINVIGAIMNNCRYVIPEIIYRLT
jgi:capsular exopolysaccharide synthesis family protein